MRMTAGMLRAWQIWVGAVSTEMTRLARLSRAANWGRLVVPAALMTRPAMLRAIFSVNGRSSSVPVNTTCPPYFANSPFANADHRSGSHSLQPQ